MINLTRSRDSSRNAVGNLHSATLTSVRISGTHVEYNTLKKRGVVLQCKRLLDEEEEEEAEEEAALADIRRRRIRMPSSLRGDVGELRKRITNMKDGFAAINENPCAMVPAAIPSLVAQNQ